MLKTNNYDYFEPIVISGNITRYLINRTGVVVNKYVMKPMLCKLDKKGYISICLYPVKGKPLYTRIHRLLALTFLECPGDPRDHQVNHINGIKTDNRLENLEWVTASGNARHAYVNGLCSSNNAVIVINIITNKSIKLKSYGDAARYLRCDRNLIFSAIRNNRPIKGYLLSPYSYKNNHDTLSSDSYYIFNSDIVGYNILTKSITIWATSSRASIDTGIGSSAIEGNASKEKSWPVLNHCFRWLDDYISNNKFRDFTIEELVCFKDKKSIKKPVKVTDINNHITVFNGPVKCAIYFKFSVATMWRIINQTKTINGYTYEWLS